MSQRRENSRPPNFGNDYAPPPPSVPFPNDFAAQPGYPNQAPYPNQQYPNYDYQVPMIPSVSNSYTPFSAPPPPAIGGFQENPWNSTVPPPPIISANDSKPKEVDEDKQKREGLYLT